MAIFAFLHLLDGTAHGSEPPASPDRCFATPDGGFTVYASDGFTPVQAAVDDLGSQGGMILIAGRCIGVQERNGITQTVYISSPVTLRGGYTSTAWNISDPIAYPTVLDADSKGRVLYAKTALTVENLSVQNGATTFGSGCGTVGQGGGSLCVRGNLTMSGTNILTSTARYQGGGAFVEGAVNISNSSFENNSSLEHSGGGLYAESTLAMTGTQIISNSARSNGGGVYAYAATIINSSFENNSSLEHSGGGLYVSSTLNMHDTRVSNNTAESHGGGVHSDTAIIVNSRLVSNKSTNDSGGGLYTDSMLAMTVTHLLSNTAYSSGGGAYVGGAANIATSRFVNNESLDHWSQVKVVQGQSN